jgi:pimeloyl-ACP methyl ester carboxylesterase
LKVLRHPRAILAGYDWGGRAACVAAALYLLPGGSGSDLALDAFL